VKRRWRGIIAIAVIASASAFAIYKIRGARAAATVPTAAARKGDFAVIVRARGELKARRSVQVSAPVNVPELRIVWLAPQGSTVKEGEPVVRFDPSSARQQLDEKLASLKQAQAALDQAIAQARISAEQDKIELAEAEYQVERAKLEVSKAEIVSRLQGEESKVDLGVAEQKLAVQKAKVSLNETSNRAKVASLTRARDKAKDEVELTQYRLEQMELRAPITGVINFMPNYSQGWMNAKPFKAGDQAWPGGALAEIPDLTTIEMEGKIEEIDRGRVSREQEVLVRVDSLPEITFPGVLDSLSPMTVMAWEWPPTRTFRAFAKLHKTDPRLRPSMNGRMDVVVDKVPGAITVPSKAVHTRDGKPMVYIARAGAYHAAEVEVIARNPDEVAIRGIDEGTEVTLIEPDEGPLLPVRALPPGKSLAAGQTVPDAGKQVRP
jgi:multidrug efflux pump subunit AcrA (membrane-fusion protein)